MRFRLDQFTTRGTKSTYISASTNDPFHKHNCAVAQATRKFATRCHDMKRRGTICELAGNYLESRTTDNTALTMRRVLAGSRECSSRLSTLLFANACCGRAAYHSSVLQRCACCRKKQSSNINPSPASPKALASSSLHLKFET